MTNYFVIVFVLYFNPTIFHKICGKDLPVDSQMKTFPISIKCIVAFRVNMLQQLHLQVNSIICKNEKILSKTFQPI